MAMSYKSRKRLSLLLLIVGIPAYLITAVTIMTRLPRPSMWVELAIYVTLGVLWAFPLKWVFKGIGQPDPDA